MTDDTRLSRNISENKAKHAATPYFREAEKEMAVQWEWFIEPLIRGGDFGVVLELAPGYGRNTAKLVPLAREMYLADVSEHCIAACRERFGDLAGECVMHYAVNDGCSLPTVPDAAVTFVYSWDAAVHFDKAVVEKYIHEFARVMRPGARGFVHHSNYGTVGPDSNWLDNPHWRSNMTADLFTQYCQNAGLRVEKQRLLAWGNIPDLDCLSVFSKPHE
jgi:ubiquinone/menaquinone biosynthesis C-methylase UbiE